MSPIKALCTWDKTQSLWGSVKPGLWTLDWTMDWTVDSLLD